MTFSSLAFIHAPRPTHSLATGNEAPHSKARSRRLLFVPRFSLRDGLVRGADICTSGLHTSTSTVGVGQRLSRKSMRDDERDLLLVQRACKIATTWPDACRVSVAISSTDAPGSDFTAHIGDILEETMLPPERLDLEFAEESFSHNTDDVFYTFSALRDIGIGTILSGFGKGVSSLTLLRDRSLSGLLSGIKTDKSLLYPSNGTSVIDHAYLQAVIGAGKNLGLHVRVDGVDHIDSISFLRNTGCDEAQGVALGRAEPSDKAEAFLNGKKRRSPQASKFPAF